MNVRHSICILSLLCAVYAAPAAAQEPVRSMPTVQAVHYVFDCQQRSLPSQRLVGAWTGQHNFSQVYASRQRLMGEIARACNKPGTEQVQLVAQAGPKPRDMQLQRVAVTNPRGR